jgi:hypothetical protein
MAKPNRANTTTRLVDLIKLVRDALGAEFYGFELDVVSVAFEGDLVTYGAVTLNQLFNILDADPDHFEPDSSVTRLYEAISSADRINFIVGGSSNLGHADIAFKQQGIMPRHKVIDLLAQKLRSEGRLVDIKQV